MGSRDNSRDSVLLWGTIGFFFAILGYILWDKVSYRQLKESNENRDSQASLGLENTSSRSKSDYVNLIGFGPTIENAAEAPTPCPEGMTYIPGGEFSMGCESKNESLCSMPGVTYDTGPIHRVYVDPFWMDITEVTNAQFQKFVDATGYVTVAEIKPNRDEFPGVPEDRLLKGSTVYRPTSKPVPLENYLEWWSYVPDANWRQPSGPGSSIEGLDNYPVVHIAFEDAEAYCKWAGKRLPTEAEWEFAARGGRAGELYTWGNELKPNNKYQANIFQGAFPLRDGDTGADGFVGICPVKQYEPNGYGLFDMGGNVWEWVSDWYRPNYYAQLKSAGVVARNPKGPEDSYDPQEPGQAKKVHRGGSFLCSDLYCNRYLLGSRGKGELRSGSNHVGFRCVKDINPPGNP